MRMSSEALKEVEAALEQYKIGVNSTNMSEKTKHTYILHSENFVRWLKADFVPGARTQ